MNRREMLKARRKAAGPIVKQIKRTIKAAMRLSEKLNDNKGGLAMLDAALAPYPVIPKDDSEHDEEIIHWVGELYRMRGYLDVTGPPYTRKTALADAERDFRTAIAWQSLRWSSPAIACLGLCEVLVFDFKDYPRALAEITKVMRMPWREDIRVNEYTTFWLTKTKAYALLALGRVTAAKQVYRKAVELSYAGKHRKTELRRDLKTLAEEHSEQAAVIPAIRAIIMD